jgi:hypothetical protein
MQPDDAWSLLAFFIGAASGFQDIFDKYRRQSSAAVATLPAVLYLISRGALPAVVFFLLLRSGALKVNLWAYALAIGTTSELFLRSSFYIKQTERPGGGIDELLRGPLDLLKWYQNLVLVEMVSTRLAAKRVDFVRKNLPNGDFRSLCTIVQSNLDAWTDEDSRAKLEQKITELINAFEQVKASSSAPPQLDEIYRLKLGYAILNAGGPTIFKTLFSSA